MCVGRLHPKITDEGLAADVPPRDTDAEKQKAFERVEESPVWVSLPLLLVVTGVKLFCPMLLSIEQEV